MNVSWLRIIELEPGFPQLKAFWSLPTILRIKSKLSPTKLPRLLCPLIWPCLTGALHLVPSITKLFLAQGFYIYCSHCLGSQVSAIHTSTHMSPPQGCLLLGRKVMTNLDSILKSRDITLPTKVYLVKAMVFPVVMYGCESWTIKKAERRRIVAFELRCWRRLLRVPWTARKSNQSIIKETSPGCSLKGLMLRLKLQYFGHLMPRADSFEKTLMLVKIWRQEEKGTTEDEMVRYHHQLNGHEFQ